MKTCVIQFANGPYIELLNLASELHQEHCQRHGYHYIASTQARTDRHPVWEKVELIRRAIEDGYEHIVWLDTDAVWHGEPLILPPTVFGMTWHDPPNDDWHYNAGVIYINNAGGQAKEPIEQWWSTPENGHKWREQHALNRLLVHHPEWVTRLSHRWNSVEYLPPYREPNPAVSAWHGKDGNCFHEVTEAVARSRRTAMQFDPAVKMDACHYSLIYGVAVATKPRRILELGIGSSVGTRMLLNAIRDNGTGELVAVDNWLDWGGVRPSGLPDDLALTIVESSEEAFVLGCRDQYDLIVSDGDHFGADRWASQTLGLLAPGGIAFFHDVSNPMFPNLGSIQQTAESAGYWCRLFDRNSLPGERCERGLLLVASR